MSKTRILLVDDSVVVRRLVSEMLNRDPALEVAGTAPNGRIALDKVDQLRPDVVILDIEMPELDGLATLAALRARQPRLPVLMFSHYTQRGAAATLDALAQGANDYVTKPDFQVAGSVESVRVQLIDKIKGLVPTTARASWPGVTMRKASLETMPAHRIQVVAIGVSTGGPNALAALLPELPQPFPVPVLVVQHMPPLFTRLLSQRLSGICPLPVSEAVHQEMVQPGHIYLCPGDYHIELQQSGTAIRIELTQGPPENSCRPSVDVLFRSAASMYGSGVLGIVLTGMGQDGKNGSAQIREAGGAVVVQDEASSVVWGMPGAVVRAGLASRVLPLEEIALEIRTRVRHGRSPSTCGC